MDICNSDNLKEMNIVIVGHVDHGKSTVIGRLLADTNSLPEGKLEQIKEMCRRNSKPFEYAFLLDALKDERSQGITIDTARSFFKTDKRKYIIIDAPGHIEFLKNMITGASRAEAAMLVIDAHEGIKENSRRHGYILSMLGIKQIAVLVNKLDLIPEEKREESFKNIINEFSEFLSKINVKPKLFIPISATEGYNIAKNSKELSWYKGMTVLETLDAFESAGEPVELPMRMWVQDIYKFTNSGDNRRIIAGTIDSGILRTNDEIMFYPSGKKTKVKSIEAFNSIQKDSVSASNATGFCMTEQIYAKRGELVCKANESVPKVGNRFKASIFWLGKEAMDKNRSYFLKIGTAKIPCRLEEIISVLNASSLESSINEKIERHEVANCIIRTEKPVAFDLAVENSATGRFVLVDRYEISGGGIITDTAEVDQNELNEKLNIRNFKWEKSDITTMERAEFYNQKPALVLITGGKQTGKKTLAKSLESRFLSEGKITYYLGIGNVLYGVNSDIKKLNSMENSQERHEHIRRLAEISNILLDAGIILIVTATNLYQEELDLFKTVVGSDTIISIWVGDEPKTDIRCDISLPDKESEENTKMIKELLKDRGIIFKFV